MKRGTFVLTPFPFSDLTTARRRPAVIVSSTDENDVIVAIEKSIIYGEIGEASQSLMREVNLRLRIAL
jgi:mRNA interferase MazF